MATFWKIGVGLSVLAFIIVFLITWISGASAYDDHKDLMIEQRNDYVALRYYIDEDNTKMAYLRIEKDTSRYELPSDVMPSSETKTFLGLRDEMGNIYVDSQGRGIISLDRDILLYPIFE